LDKSGLLRFTSHLQRVFDFPLSLLTLQVPWSEASIGAVTLKASDREVLQEDSLIHASLRLRKSCNFICIVNERTALRLDAWLGV
jgi:hypothetical protein